TYPNKTRLKRSKTLQTSEFQPLERSVAMVTVHAMRFLGDDQTTDHLLALFPPPSVPPTHTRLDKQTKRTTSGKAESEAGSPIMQLAVEDLQHTHSALKHAGRDYVRPRWSTNSPLTWK
ncbi:uncharacterized, partial [Tachysurus ichikawai]